MSMNKIFLIIFCLSLLLGLTICHKRDHISIYDINKPTKPLLNISIIDEINNRNAKISTFYAEIEIDTKIKLTSQVFYEKDKRFRMRTMSRFGLEGDIGSNDTQFWFWSKRMNPPALYHADHKDYMKTTLKPLFDPNWLMQCFNISNINLSEANIGHQGNNIIVKKSKVGNLGSIVINIIFIDSINERILGNYLYSDQGKMIASAEVKEFQNVDGFVIPKIIVINWQDEGLTFMWKLVNIKINKIINDKLWILPHTNNMVEMSSMP